MTTRDNDLKKRMGPRRMVATPVADTFVEAETNEPSPALVPATTKEAKETSQTSVRLPADLHRRARYYSVDTGVSLNTLIVEALRAELDRRGAN